MNVFSSCFGLFVDTKDYVYCSMPEHHQVTKRDFNDPVMVLIVIAGTGDRGATSIKLNRPHGIFVDMKLDLYVADCGNDRIQKFSPGEISGYTVVSGASKRYKYSLSCPIAIIKDSQQFLFIIDSNHHRVIRAGSNSVRCVIGCDGINIKSTELASPSNLAFDSLGNMFVVDRANSRIQKFYYSKNSCNMSAVFERKKSSKLNENSQIYSRNCDWRNYHYEAFEMNVAENRYYTVYSSASINTYGSIYENKFNPLNPAENLLIQNDNGTSNDQFKFELPLYDDTTYVLVVTTSNPMVIGDVTIHISGLIDTTVKRLTSPIHILFNHSSELTKNSPMYYRDCHIPKCYYETYEIRVNTNGSYIIWSVSEMHTYGYIYQNNFDPLRPSSNKLFEHNGTCNQEQFKFIVDLQINTRYILVVTTFHSYTTGRYSLSISGLNETNVTVVRSNPKIKYCVIGDQCKLHYKSIGLTLDDILYEELRKNSTLSEQIFSVKLTAALTILMFIAGLINSLFSFTTFQNKETQKVGCGLYLLISSITSFLTVVMFVIKYWFVLLTQINDVTSVSIHRGGCKSIEPILKLFLYFDGWLNGCVAVERAFHVFKGVTFDKRKSKVVAQWVIVILPLCISGTLMHEFIYRDVFSYQIARNTTFENGTEVVGTRRYVWCVTGYSPSVQNYNTVILFFHLLGPFVANLFSALFIILGAARQRSKAQSNRSMKMHIREQISEHRQLLISPIVLLLLSIPRLVISLLPGCVNASEKLWLYLGAYFISFVPSILIFVIFVVPSELYMKTFKESITKWRR
ncbi:unnamed protein product [Adineta ricciae]|uniref:G protein-coupled receptor n=1 Tax=Adineta ricciae TaxID=249248 RepID=A0A816F9Q4_ADIRI|nr:unnamed protein product [Adineta ricciae]